MHFYLNRDRAEDATQTRGETAPETKPSAPPATSPVLTIVQGDGQGGCGSSEPPPAQRETLNGAGGEIPRGGAPISAPKTDQGLPGLEARVDIETGSVGVFLRPGRTVHWTAVLAILIVAL